MPDPNHGGRPLADALRPEKIEDVIGQHHLLDPGKPLRIYLDSGCTTSAIFYGPPGTGKTTMANVIAARSGRPLIRLNATTAGTADIREVFKAADASDQGVLLYLDEIQFFNKKQQQTLLSYVESGKVQLIGSTTENPYFYIYKALLSRSLVFEFKPVSQEDIQCAVLLAVGRLISDPQNPSRLAVAPDVPRLIADAASGDVRKALTILDMAIQGTAPDASGTIRITKDSIKACGQNGSVRFDRGGDEMYDIASGLHKSLRGSDPDAALHYLARFLEAGDLLTPIRRLLCAASEDVGLAYSQCAVTVKALCDTALQLGLPEAQLPLAHAAILICNAPKSGSVHEAINAAWDDVRAGAAAYPLPRTLQNVHADTTETVPCCAKQAQNYLYPHDYPNHWVEQPYLPEALAGTRYYHFGDNPSEQNAKNYWQQIKGEQL